MTFDEWFATYPNAAWSKAKDNSLLKMGMRASWEACETQHSAQTIASLRAKIRKEGYDWFYAHIEDSPVNPYPPGTGEHEEWADGYYQADVYEAGD